MFTVIPDLCHACVAQLHHPGLCLGYLAYKRLQQVALVGHPVVQVHFCNMSPEGHMSGMTLHLQQLAILLVHCDLLGQDDCYWILAQLALGI